MPQETKLRFAYETIRGQLVDLGFMLTTRTTVRGGYSSYLDIWVSGEGAVVLQHWDDGSVEVYLPVDSAKVDETCHAISDRFSKEKQKDGG